MEIEVFRKNVMKTVALRPVKLGMRYASKNSLRTASARGVVMLRYNVGNLLHAVSPYVLGLQFNQEMKNAASIALGDVGADLVYLAKILKVKTPTATKKVKLSGTRTAALIQLDMMANDMLGVLAGGLFTGPRMTYVKKQVVMPTKGGAKEMRDVEVIDQDAEQEIEKVRLGNLRSLLAGAIDIYWRLCFNMAGKPPASLFEEKVERLKLENPKIEWEPEEATPETVQGAA